MINLLKSRKTTYAYCFTDAGPAVVLFSQLETQPWKREPS